MSISQGFFRFGTELGWDIPASSTVSGICSTPGTGSLRVMRSMMWENDVGYGAASVAASTADVVATVGEAVEEVFKDRSSCERLDSESVRGSSPRFCSQIL